jgi:hypothetical protein
MVAVWEEGAVELKVAAYKKTNAIGASGSSSSSSSSSAAQILTSTNHWRANTIRENVTKQLRGGNREGDEQGQDKRRRWRSRHGKIERERENEREREGKIGERGKDSWCHGEGGRAAICNEQCAMCNVTSVSLISSHVSLLLPVSLLPSNRFFAMLPSSNRRAD